MNVAFHLRFVTIMFLSLYMVFFNLLLENAGLYIFLYCYISTLVIKEWDTHTRSTSNPWVVLACDLPPPLPLFPILSPPYTLSIYLKLMFWWIFVYIHLETSYNKRVLGITTNKQIFVNLPISFKYGYFEVKKNILLAVPSQTIRKTIRWFDTYVSIYSKFF